MPHIDAFLRDYDSTLVNRLEPQSRQPSLYFAALMVDHEWSFQIMKRLIDHGANVHFRDRNGQTVLFYVCREGKEKCLDLLLEAGLSLNDKDVYGQTPLFYVARENRLNIIAKLIEKKVDLNVVDRIGGQTALFYAAREGHLEMMRVLIQAGASSSHTDNSHKTAISYAKRSMKKEDWELLSSESMAGKDVKEDTKDSTSKKRKLGQVKQPYRLYRSDTMGNMTELTRAEFEEFLRKYPRIAAMIDSPDSLELSLLEEARRRESWVKAALKVLTVCWKSKGAHYFHEPVDPVKYGIENYFEIILEPMDFGTIRKRLTANVYNSIQEFTADMRLVFDNCVKYNGIENHIAKQAIEIRGIFEENMKINDYPVA